MGRDHKAFPYIARAVLDGPDPTEVTDVELVWPGKRQRLAGRDGKTREQALLAQLKTDEQDQNVLPVFLGSGLGWAVKAYLEENDGPLAVVDKEEPVLAVSGALERLGNERLDNNPRVFWVREQDPETVLALLTRWQMDQGNRPLRPVTNPFYLRLDREFYGLLKESLQASSEFDFWSRTRYPRFQSALPRVLLITSSYFLMGEVVQACKRIGVPHHFIRIEDDEVGSITFVRELLSAVLEFKPDFVFTINHLGVDREGVLAELLHKLRLPLASWFVDNPHLILYLYKKLASELSVIFTWDKDNIPSLRERDFSNVHYLPLGTDPDRFRPIPAISQDMDVAFVGNSMLYKVGHRLKAGKFPRDLLVTYRQVAAEFGEHQERSVRAFLEKHHPELFTVFLGLDSLERQLAYEAMITWEATRRYRRSCVEQILPLNPVIAGDKGWNITFRHSPHTWRYHSEMNYYTELPRFYPRAAVNFNCTSKQMKGAVNQRVFDAPAAGAFVLTDWREQIDELFEPGKEVVCYHDPEEIPELAQRYLKDKQAREAVALAARKRVLAEHSYEHRIRELLDVMRASFA